MKLKLKRIAIDTYKDNVALLSRSCTPYHAEAFQALKKIQIANESKQLYATLMITDEDTLVGADELGLSEQAFDHFGLPEGTHVTISQAPPPTSIHAVRAKMQGHALTPEHIDSIIHDIVSRRYSEMEIAAFLVAAASSLSADEVLHLTKAMADAGNRLTWESPLVVDKHCIGGIPGNRTSMIVVPIVAAHGLAIPKTSSRAITSPAGTADTMEVLARVDLSIEHIQSMVDAHHGCLAWGGHVNLSPADDMMIAIERPLGIDTREQMVASILSKKVSAGSTHLLIDIPVGPTAKIRSQEDAVRLKKLFEFVADRIGLFVQPIFTDGTQPIGRGIGPVLEARDVIQVLRNDPDAPQDLREKSLLLAGHIIDFDPALRGGQGHTRAEELLTSGQALEKMEQMIDAQGRQEEEQALGHLVLKVPAPKKGVVTAIDNYRLSRIASLAGAPMDKGAGIDLLKKVGDSVRFNEPLYHIYACNEADFGFAATLAGEDTGYTLGG